MEFYISYQKYGQFPFSHVSLRGCNIYVVIIGVHTPQRGSLRTLYLQAQLVKHAFSNHIILPKASQILADELSYLNKISHPKTACIFHLDFSPDQRLLCWGNVFPRMDKNPWICVYLRYWWPNLRGKLGGSLASWPCLLAEKVKSSLRP